ncbi:unnamed protein product [Adineta ricciae]|uniref:Transmembrane protein n=1 Tax=Adineta ricciae TaxID=249248 RepID=A0A815GQ62_ADIRI|nr:unnamed protein product [Adineta ricciae]
MFISNKDSIEYFLDTCCSLNGNERIYLSCGLNEKIHLNLIEIYFNSDSSCLSPYSCCQKRTKCSRRITKYFSLHCDEQNSCWINKTCLKIYKSCANSNDYYGQYLTINYSCLSFNENLTKIVDEEILSPFIVKLFTEKKNERKSFENSQIFLIGIICSFIFLMLIIYSFANFIGKKFCQNISQKNQSQQIDLIPKKILVKHDQDQKITVQSVNCPSPTRIYPIKTTFTSNPKSFYIPHSHYSYRPFINVYQDPFTGQISSRTFYYY